MPNKTKQIRAFAPATIANLGPGFDCLGLALTGLGDIVTATKRSDHKAVVESMTGLCAGIPFVSSKNTATVAAKALLKIKKKKHGFSLNIQKNIIAGSGLGSSAASSVAAVVAVDKLFKLKSTWHDLIEAAMEGERAASGVAHADNVSPGVLGGITLVHQNKPLEVLQLSSDLKLYIVVLQPNISLSTSVSRKVLPKQIALSLSSKQSAHLASLTAGFCTHDYDLIRCSMIDEIVEPARSKLIPHFKFID